MVHRIRILLFVVLLVFNIAAGKRQIKTRNLERSSDDDDPQGKIRLDYPIPYGGYEATEAVVEIQGVTGSGVHGTVFFYQPEPQAPLIIRGTVYGLSPGGHGMHVHNGTSTGVDCSEVGVHFNPYREVHGGPYDRVRHAGDFGNLFSYSIDYKQTLAKADLEVDPRTSLFEPNSIIGHALVIHTSMDDLGRGANPGSKMTGNSGVPVACGIIREIYHNQY